MERFLTKSGTGGWNLLLLRIPRMKQNRMIVLRLRTERNRSRTERLGKKEQEQNDQAERFKKKVRMCPALYITGLQKIFGFTNSNISKDLKNMK